jgi:transcriptional regulator GlxA family with amidase domain
MWRNVASEETKLKLATSEFLRIVQLEPPSRRPGWLQRAQEDLRRSPGISTDQLARKLNLHPAWFARSYRLAAGEGVADTRRRNRLETAMRLLRNSNHTLTDIAAEAGFFDQSHMNRNFVEVLGKTPLRVRNDYPHGTH